MRFTRSISQRPFWLPPGEHRVQNEFLVRPPVASEAGLLFPGRTSSLKSDACLPVSASRDLFGSRWANIRFKIHSLFARTPPAEPEFLSLGRTSSLKSDTCLPIPAFRDLFGSRWANYPVQNRLLVRPLAASETGIPHRQPNEHQKTDCSTSGLPSFPVIPDSIAFAESPRIPLYSNCPLPSARTRNSFGEAAFRPGRWEGAV